MSKKRKQSNELLRQELSDLIFRKIDFPKGCLVTVIRTEIDKEYKTLFVYLSVLPNQFTGKVLKILNKKSGFLTHLLSKKLTYKNIPKFKFLLENVSEYYNEYDL